MDARVVRAMELLKEAGRLDLLAAPAAPWERPVRRAASGVAAAVAACSPPRERKQVSGAGRGRSGRLAPGYPGRAATSLKSRPRPLGVRRPRGGSHGGGRGGEENPAGPRQRRRPGRLQAGRAPVGGGPVLLRAVGDSGAGVQSTRRPAGKEGPAGLTAAAVGEWEGQGGHGVGSRSGESEQVSWGPELDLNSWEEGCLEQMEGRSEDGDPSELLAGSEPWEEEEEVLAGPSVSSWTGCRRGGKAVRATEVITHATSGKGLAPPGGWGNKGKLPGYALQREGVNTPLRRPRIPAAPIEEFIKKARFGSQAEMQAPAQQWMPPL
ncbi:hypothetical protein NDU88_006039 [Pleurodeles waltl]|uniref:Uncharacterized protein n=1 Tax=Pleurodeles waltl TaxID=8319 RepID=A0AAV7QJP9_PLEWA|nr:hypothetical protein NDU88_006039 [Pleurodeles waltl]